jgi:hypothetical protein
MAARKSEVLQGEWFIDPLERKMLYLGRYSIIKKTKDGKVIYRMDSRYVYLHYDKILKSIKEEPFDIPIDELLKKVTMSIFYARPYEAKEEPIFLGDTLYNWTNIQKQFSDDKNMIIRFGDDVEDYTFTPIK